MPDSAPAPSPQMEAIVAELRRRRERRRGQPRAPVAERRAAIDKLGDLFPLPEDVAVEAVDAGGVPAHRLRPPQARPGRVVFYLHGGGYGIGSLRSHGELAARVARAAEAAAFLPAYALAPERAHPAALDDALAAYRWLLHSGTAAGAVTLAGDSAGGGLAVSMCLALREAGDPLPAALALLSPWLDLTCSSEGWRTRLHRDPILDDGLRAAAREYLAGSDPRDPAASPLFADPRGLPPTLVQVGTEEVLYDEAEAFAAAARAAGVDITFESEPAVHVWQIFASAPEAVAATDRVGAFLAARV